jgi:hypothetical protein
MMKKTAIYVAAFTLALLVLNGCSNMFLEKPQDRSVGEIVTGAPGKIPEGFGTVTVSLTRGAARTIMPEIELSSLYLTYLFTKDGGVAEEKTPADGKFTLEPGVYSLELRAFADGAKQTLVAQGTTDANFTISAGSNAGTVNLSLRPVVSGTGTGELEYRLEYPVGATVETLSLTRIAGAESPINLAAGGTASSTGLSGTRSNIPVGYYLLRAALKNSGGSTGLTEVVHIYQNLRARVEYVFSADDFRGYRVSSAADTGPGSLRQALTNALSMTGGPQTIQVVLAPGAVIELGSALPAITKSLTIEGNGVTLTRAASWTAGSSSSQLLRITGSTVEALLRGLHFKNGLATDYGGAIHNEGILTLESCVFSGNRTTGSNAQGGAIDSQNTLTIRGCTFYGNTTTGSYGGGAVYFSGGTLILTGNLFYGNTASDYPVVRNRSGTVSASYNVADAAFGTGTAQAGWAAGTGDVVTAALPISPLSFRLLYGSEAGAKLPATFPADYPLTDFYGNSINGGGAAGAVQASTAHGSGYYYLDISVNNSLRGNIMVNSTPDADGLYPVGSIITVSSNGGYSFGYLLVNGVKTSTASLSLSTHTWVQGVFNGTVTVNIFTDGTGSAATPGTLRYALSNIEDGDTIRLSGGTAGTTTIELGSALPEITKSLTIEGNGVTLTRAASWTAGSSSSQLLYINGSTAEVLIRRLHFKDGLATTNGGAIDNRGILTLESCIFSGNRTTSTSAYGGVLYSNNTLTIRGCTFYGNTSGYRGGAVYFSASGKTLALTGNLFYGNTATYPVVYNSGGTVSASYNMVDVAFGTGSTQAGWAAGTGDTTTSAAMVVSPLSFRPLYGSDAGARLPATLPTDYPLTDFYENPISSGGAAGAVQGSTAQGYYYVELSVNNSLGGSVTVSPPPDADGFCPAGFISITASPSSGYSLGYWLVNGVKTGTASISLSAHSFVQAVFNRAVTVTVFTDGAGSAAAPTLRYALNNAQDGDIISLSGGTAGTTTIELGSTLPEITKNLTIEGNGVILTRVASWTGSYTSQLLRITSNSAEVLLRRLYFKDGLSTDSGGAIYNTGILTLESCIFNGNWTIGAYGGAIYSTNTLTIQGCTFYGNTAGSYGGTVYFSASGKTLTLTGNLFYGNTAAYYPVVYINYGTVSASYNVVDVAVGMETAQTGWTAGTGDTTTSAPLVSPLSLRLLYGSGAGSKLPAALPVDYPLADFYGDPISGGGAAGAVQASTAHGSGYYYLELSVNNSLGGSVTVNSTPDTDGLYPVGSIITAIPNSGYSLGYWLVNGVKTGTVSTSLSAYSLVQAVFNRVVTVNVFTDGTGSASTPGTLRYALTNAQDGDVIILSGVMAGTTVIELESALPEITKRLTIEGNGVTLTRAASWTSSSNISQLLRITDSTAEVLVREVRFKDSLATDYGSAIRNSGILTLESCIFSSNRTGSGVYGGGALYSTNTLIIQGCTFYGNASGYYGGAVYFSASGKTLTLTGNLFYGNTAVSSYPVVRNNSGTVNASYNVVDAAFGTGSAQAGWTAGTGDTTISSLPVSPLSFRLLYGSEAGIRLPSTLPADYSLTDFYGDPISGGGAAGAVQASTVHGSGYYYLDLSVNNSLWGSITVSSTPDADGLYPAGSIITASPNSGYSFAYWLVNGVKTGGTSTSLSAHSLVQAVFNRVVMVNIFTDGAESASTSGTLRYALTNAEDGDIISMSGVTAGTTVIELGSALPTITKSFAIEGNGVILTRAASWTASSDTSQLLRITGSTAEVLIRGLHFKDGLATDYGSVIRNTGILTLESCIFSGSRTTSSYAYGGAIYSNNTLTIRGCPFYGNTTDRYGGAVYFSASGKTLTLTGNLFYGNTASSYPVVYRSSGTISASYNAADAAFGTGTAQAGWAAGTGDTTFTALGISGDPFNTTSFVPVSALQSPGVLPVTAPTDFPVTDFYGAARTFPGAPGAVAAAPTP